MQTFNQRCRIGYACDTPGCKAAIQTPATSHGAASNYARKRGWAIGIDLDDCGAHHV